VKIKKNSTSIKRGDIWWTELPEPRGSEAAYTRPSLVLQSDSYNQSKLATVVVIPITTNLKLATSPGNVYIQAGLLKQDSVINVSQVVHVHKEFLLNYVGQVNPETMALVEAGIKQVLGLD
jgi:mRNA interferase MazF